ncbi:hypothetical protein LG200_05210 [Methylobacillus caricis]|uniref:hypothetical protein n=1 Tax=Methylobacillus caricis TaxID=1971611 RepID=UPI001CFF9518|nr:hypothetical protein [Methylobacillus caricis]MCB5187403.1 hypothetical protein [Methylobacillus caricis]
MKVKITLPPCDCINRCGDDPWISTGKAKPCKSYIEWQARLLAAQSRDDRIKSALIQAESFISGFEDDELQDGVEHQLVTLRGLIQELEVKA